MGRRCERGASVSIDGCRHNHRSIPCYHRETSADTRRRNRTYGHHDDHGARDAQGPRTERKLGSRRAWPARQR